MTRTITQSPLNINVANRIVHGGSYQPPYLVINKSLVATVWVSANPGMSPGQGTPISPGTYIQWTQKGDIYLILGDDRKSLDATSADVCISYDVGDWAPNPVAIASAAINRQQALTTDLSGGLTLAQINAITNLPSGPGIDGSLFNSLLIYAVPNSPGTAGTQLIVSQYFTLADMQALNTPAWRQSWQWYGTTTASGPDFRVHIPLRAPYIRWTVAGSAFWTFGASLSSQVISDVRYGTNTTPKNGIYFDANQINCGNLGVAPAVSNNLMVSPMGGRVSIMAEVNYGVALAAGALNAFIGIFTNNSLTAQNRICLIPLVSGPFAGFGVVNERVLDIDLPTDQLIITLTNNIAQATTAWRILITGTNHFRGD